MGATAGPYQGIGGRPDRSGPVNSGPPSSQRSGTLTVRRLGSAPYFRSSRMAGTSSVYAAHQNGVEPDRSTLSRSRLYVVYHSDFLSRAFGSAPAFSNASASSR